MIRQVPIAKILAMNIKRKDLIRIKRSMEIECDEIVSLEELSNAARPTRKISIIIDAFIECSAHALLHLL